MRQLSKPFMLTPAEIRSGFAKMVVFFKLREGRHRRDDAGTEAGAHFWVLDPHATLSRNAVREFGPTSTGLRVSTISENSKSFRFWTGSQERIHG